jgi:hypothetical protein
MHTGEYIVELNCIARRAHLWAWNDLIPNDTERTALPAIARRFLNQFWREHEGELHPKIQPTALFSLPDEVVIKARDGRMVCRWTITDEMNSRYRAV